MKEKITNNWSLKLLSLFIAFVVWVVIVNIEDPIISKNVSGIAVTVINENAISEAGKCYVIDSDGTVQIRVKGPKSVIDKLKPTDFTAVADLSKYSITNTVPVEVNFTSKRNLGAEPDIVYGKNNNINIILDDFETKSYDVQLNTVGTVTEGYYVSKEQIELDSEKIKISGPGTTLNNIKKVTVDVNLSDIKEETFVLCKVKVLDNYGSVIESDRLTFNRDVVNVTVKPLIEKEVPIKVVTEGKPFKEFSVNNATCDMDSVTIVGERESVDSMQVIELKVDVTGQKKKIKKKFDVSKYISSTVKLMSSKIKATVEIDFKKMVTKELSFKADEIEFRNIKTGYLNKFDNDKKLKITIKGLEQYIENITIAELKPYIDLKLMKVGKYKVKVLFDNTKDIKITKYAYLEIDIEDSREVNEEDSQEDSEETMTPVE
jgi:YbbR domain-containing protein